MQYSPLIFGLQLHCPRRKHGEVEEAVLTQQTFRIIVHYNSNQYRTNPMSFAWVVFFSLTQDNIIKFISLLINEVMSFASLEIGCK